MRNLIFIPFCLLYICISGSVLKADENRRSYGIEIIGGYCNYANQDINEIFKRLSREEIDKGPVFRASFRFPVHESFSLFLGVGYLTGNSKYENVITGENSPDPVAYAEDEYKITSIPVSGGVGYTHPFRSFFLQVNIAMEYHFTRMTYKFPAVSEVSTPEYSDEQTGTGLGFSITPGLILPLSDRFSVPVNAGYRYLKLNDFSRDEHIFPLNFSLDLSGFFFEGGLSFNF